MDVRLPDGTIIRNVPEGTTRAQLMSKLRAGGYDVSGFEEPEERTFGGYAKEALKGLVPGAVGLGETAITGAAALLPDEAEEAIRRPVSEFAESVRERFAPAPGYEDTTVRKLSEAVGSTLPFLPLGALGAAGRIAATGLGVSAGAGEARQRAEEEEATEGERAAATALGAPVGALEALPPIRILRRLGFGDEAIEEVAGFAPALRRAAQAGGEEALQEASSQVLQNLIAKGVYAPDEEVFGGVGEAAATGGGAGAIVSAIADLALGRRLRGVESAPERREEEPAPPAETPVAEAPAVTEEEPVSAIDRREEIERRARELRFLATQDDRLRAAIEKQEQDEASKDDLDYLAQYDAALRARDEARRRPLGEEDQMGLPLVGGAAQLDLLAPTEPGEAIPGVYRPAEEALADLRPRSRAYKEEAKDLGLKLDRKGNLKPNQFVPDITAQVSPDQERFEFESQQQLPLTLPSTFEGQGDLFAQEPIPAGSTVPFTRQEPTVEVPTIEVPKEQMALNLPGMPMERLAPRDRVLRAMAITEDKKNIPNLKFATQLRPMELQKAIGDLKKEGAIAFNNRVNEWELTPVGAERVRSGPEVKPARPRRGAGVSVQQPRTKAPPTAGVGEQGMADAGETVTRTDVGAGTVEPTLTEKTSDQIFDEAEAVKNQALSLLSKDGKLPAIGSPKREQFDALKQQLDSLKRAWDDKRRQEIRQETLRAAGLPVNQERRDIQQQVSQQAINQVTDRRSALRTQAIDAFDNDQIDERTYTQITEQLKRPVPNFGVVEKVLSGEVKPGRKGIKFQRTYNPQVGTPQFKNWFGDSKAVDQEGKPLVLYRGAVGAKNIPEGALEGKAREGYATFASTSPQLAATYGQPEFEGEAGAVTPLYVKANKLIEFPVQINKEGYRRFDKFEFDRQAQRLRPGEVLVARQVIDYGPRANVETDPERLYSYPSDIYAWGKGTSVKSAVGNVGAFDTTKESILAQRGKIGAGLPIDRARAVADDAVRTWTNAPKVVVASSVNDPVIPENIRKQIPEDAPGFYVNETTYVLADRAKDEATVRGTVFHESLGHYGLEQEFQGGLQDVMQGIYDTNPKMQAAAKTRMEKFGLDAATAVEEVLAERSETGPIKESWLRAAYGRVAAYIRNFMRQRGLVSTYSDNDVNQILKQAHRRVIKGKKAPYDPFNPAVRYQRSPEAQRKGDRAFVNAVGKISQSLPAATKETYEAARNAASNLPTGMRRVLYTLYDPHEMGRIYSKDLKSDVLEKLWKNANQEGTELRKMQDTLMDNMTKWGKVMEKYSEAEQNKIRDLFMATTTTKTKVQVVTAKGKVKEKEVSGLVKRRKAEVALFLS